MTEKKFAELVTGLSLSEAEIAILRKQFNLPYEENDLPTDEGLRRRLLWRTLDKLPQQKK